MENESDWLIDVTAKGSFQNQYILGDIIGRGSTSTIHSCLHKGRKKYACKIMPKARLKKVDTGTRLQALLRLRHNNIVSVKEVYDDNLRIFVIEDLASGGELLERLASCGGYSERDAANAVRDAATALEYLHSMDFCHGSLRPEKLLYATDDDNSRLLLAGTEATTISQSSYKILYCAPEVMKTGKPGSSSDIWSLGIVLYIMLCGFEPFRKTEEMFPSPYWDDKTDEAKCLISQLMQQSPEDRPTATDLLANSWVRGVKTAEHSMTDVAKKLREFNARRKFKAATYAVTATHRAIAMSHCHGEEDKRKMSPEPTQEPIEQNLSASNLTTAAARAINDSDSEDEDAGMAGYMPLSQVPTDADLMLDDEDDDEDDEWIAASVDRSQGLSAAVPDEGQEIPSETIQVWTSLCNRSNIDLDPDKIDQVKSMMATFTLPVTAIPEWANSISEEQWKEQLIDRIKEMQNREA